MNKHTPEPWEIRLDKERGKKGRTFATVIDIKAQYILGEIRGPEVIEIVNRLTKASIQRINPEMVKGLLVAAKWAEEMMGYAIHHLEDGWALTGGCGSTNRSDFRSALEGLTTAIAKAEEGAS